MNFLGDGRLEETTSWKRSENNSRSLEWDMVGETRHKSSRPDGWDMTRRSLQKVP